MADQQTLRILAEEGIPYDTVRALDREAQRSRLKSVVDALSFGVFSDSERAANLDRRWLLVLHEGQATVLTVRGTQVIDASAVPDWDPSRARMFRTFALHGYRYRVMNQLS
ncbi:MAG: hypothetical protein Q4G34_01680 [Micrococcus sp.]|nr:hypothetical protein [Micrococcus sp.]